MGPFYRACNDLRKEKKICGKVAEMRFSGMITSFYFNQVANRLKGYVRYSQWSDYIY